MAFPTCCSSSDCFGCKAKVLTVHLLGVLLNAETFLCDPLLMKTAMLSLVFELEAIAKTGAFFSQNVAHVVKHPITFVGCLE